MVPQGLSQPSSLCCDVSQSSVAATVQSTIWFRLDRVGDLWGSVSSPPQVW